MLTFFGFGRQIADEPLLVRGTNGTPSNNLTKPNIFYPFTESWQAMEDALEIYAYYSKMFEAFAVVPAMDISSTLYARTYELWAEKPWEEFGKFLQRLEAFMEAKPLTPNRRATIEAFLNKQRTHFGRCLWLVEERPYVRRLDKGELRLRCRNLKIAIECPERDLQPFFYASNYIASSADVFLEIEVEEVLPGLESRSPKWALPAWKSIHARKESLKKSLQEVDRRLALIAASEAVELTQGQPAQTVDLISALSDYRRIALFLHYENKPTPTATILLQLYGKPSVKQLKKYYNALHGSSSRTAAQGKELVPMIEAIEAVIPVLGEKARQVANEELSKLTIKR